MIRRANQFGLTLVEVLVAVTLLTILRIPAMRALQTSVTGADVHSDLASSRGR